MFDYWYKLTYKNRYIATASAVVLLAMYLYFAGIHKTLSLHRQNNALRTELSLTEGGESKIKKSVQRKNTIDALFNSMVVEESGNQEVVLDKINSFKKQHRVEIIQLQNPHAFETGNYIIHTLTITLRGSFKDLLQLFYLFETEYKLGKVAALDFRKEYDRKNKTQYLLGDIYIQTIILKELNK